MFKSRYKWQILNENEVSTEKELWDILYNNRNLTSAVEKSRYLSDELFLYDPYLFRDMKKAVSRIKTAVANKEKIMLYGDFDVDGVTGVAILYKALKKLAANVFYYIPSRFTEGYGPNEAAYDNFIKHDFTLIITVDNGITGINEAKLLKENNVDLIITDHHEPLSALPDAYAILHAKLDNETYPFKDLSGCGVTFKLAQGLLNEVPLDLIDLAGLGTVSDMVSLTSENRTIVKWGIKQLSNTTHLGLRLLLQGLNLKKLDESSLGFILAPRLNAPGRMDNGNVAVRLLVTEDYQEASDLVLDIESLNSDRKLQIDVIIEEAIEEISIRALDDYNVIVVERENWHEGVLGIVCNRLIDIYHKPVIVLTESNGVYKGSGRTLDDFSLHENLTKVKDILIKFGGHKMACGLSLDKANIPLLRERLHELALYEINNYLKIDSVLNENLINLPVVENLQKLRPFGQHNPNPLFLIRDCEVVTLNCVGNLNKHLKLVVKKNNLSFEAIAFNMGSLSDNINNHDLVDIVGNLDINEYNNQKSCQIRVEDISCRYKQIFDCRKQGLIKRCDYSYIYFNHNFNYQEGEVYTSNRALKKDVVLIDVPTRLTEFKEILNANWHNLYLLFKYNEIFTYEHLVTRDKLAKIYLVYKKIKRFKRNDVNVVNKLEKMGYNKDMQNLAIQVFFELDFAIIEGNEIIFVDKPDKRDLSESITYKQLKEEVHLKEQLLLSSQDELKYMINNLITIKEVSKNGA